MKPENIPPRIFPLLQSCHSILGTAWPKPGCQQLSDSRTFIGTNLFIALRNGAIELDRLFTEMGSNGSNGPSVLLWKVCHDVMNQLNVLGRKSEHPRIDSAFNLLYLAVGVLYQTIAHNVTETPKQDAQFSTVPEIDELMQNCQWRGNGKDVVGQLIDSLATILEELQTPESEGVWGGRVWGELGSPIRGKVNTKISPRVVF